MLFFEPTDLVIMKKKDIVIPNFLQIEQEIARALLLLSDISDIIPASIMIHNIVDGMPEQIIYMNEWGCKNLGTTLEDLNAMKEEYYDQFFVRDDLYEISPQLAKYCQEGDLSTQINFFQRVKLVHQSDYSWFYTVCKLMPIEPGQSQKLIMLSSPVDGIDTLMRKVKKVLDENEYILLHYKRFALLTKREKEILSLICYGKSSLEISEILFISKETVATHRKNIIRKLELKSFAELLRFALAFELVE